MTLIDSKLNVIPSFLLLSDGGGIKQNSDSGFSVMSASVEIKKVYFTFIISPQFKNINVNQKTKRNKPKQHVKCVSLCSSKPKNHNGEINEPQVADPFNFCL